MYICFSENINCFPGKYMKSLKEFKALTKKNMSLFPFSNLLYKCKRVFATEYLLLSKKLSKSLLLYSTS